MSIAYDSYDDRFPLQTPEGKAGLLQQFCFVMEVVVLVKLDSDTLMAAR